MRYDGTRATLIGRYYFDEQVIELHDHLTGEVEIIPHTLPSMGASGHASGDAGSMAAFVRAVCDSAEVLTTARNSLESHLMAFAAEKARLSEAAVSMTEFRRQALELG